MPSASRTDRGKLCFASVHPRFMSKVTPFVARIAIERGHWRDRGGKSRPASMQPRDESTPRVDTRAVFVRR